MKKFSKKSMFSMLLVIVLLLSAACSNNQAENGKESDITPSSEVPQPSASSDTKEEKLEEKTYQQIDQHVKLLGRTHFINNTLYLAHSASGIEFTFTGTKAEITIIGDNAAIQYRDGSLARYAVYVDGTRTQDIMLEEALKTVELFSSKEQKETTIRIVKLSESAQSTMGLRDLKVTCVGDITPTEQKKVKIEFIGDSITCGYGVDDENKMNHFSTATEDATKTYAYKTAENLNADYSMVSYSGYGIISGYSGDGEKKDDQIVPKYYENFAFSYGDPYQVGLADLKWDFTKFQPDVVVINLGTNDDSYCKQDAEKRNEYQAQYVEFIKQIRKNNPKAHILCTLGIMGDSLYEKVEAAVVAYKTETNDANVSSMKFDVQVAEDGYAADWHPTEKTHTKASQKLTDEIAKILSVEVTSTSTDEETKALDKVVDISWIDLEKPVIALTYDDGPQGDYEGSSSNRILNVLEQNKAHATFFYLGQKINDASKGEIVRAHNLGNEVANHSFTHANLSQLTEEELRSEIDQTSSLLSEITGQDSFVLRPPFGSISKTMQEVVTEPMILWDIDTVDWNNATTANDIIEKVKANVKDEAIVLMHEIYDHTAEASEVLVPYLINEGYQLVTVSELSLVKAARSQ